jgi:hypothetical protein
MASLPSAILPLIIASGEGNETMDEVWAAKFAELEARMTAKLDAQMAKLEQNPSPENTRPQLQETEDEFVVSKGSPGRSHRSATITGGIGIFFSPSEQPLTELVGPSIFLALLTERRFWFAQLLCTLTIVLQTTLYGIFMTAWGPTNMQFVYTPSPNVAGGEDDDGYYQAVFEQEDLPGVSNFNITLPYKGYRTAENAVFSAFGLDIHAGVIFRIMARLMFVQGLLPNLSVGIQLLLHSRRQGWSADAREQGTCCYCMGSISPQHQLLGTGMLMVFLQLFAFFAFWYYVNNIQHFGTPAGTVQLAVSALFINQVDLNAFTYIKKSHPKLAARVLDSVRQLDHALPNIYGENLAKFNGAFPTDRKTGAAASTQKPKRMYHRRSLTVTSPPGGPGHHSSWLASINQAQLQTPLPEEAV